LSRLDVAGKSRIMTTKILDTQRVWSQLSSDLRRFIRRRVPDDHTTDDLLQETFVRIHRGLPALGDDNRLTAWVYRIANNVLADHHRKRKPASSIDEASIPAPPAGPPSIILAGAATWLEEIIDTLPEASREAIRLSELEGLTQKVVADRLGLTLSGAKSRIQRGRGLLQEALLACCRFDTDRHGNLVDCTPLANRTVCLNCDDRGVETNQEYN
jgi:RNA polymerase sigma-70 factor, ECF subfamily